jgi:hypothetical protein
MVGQADLVIMARTAPPPAVPPVAGPQPTVFPVAMTMPIPRLSAAFATPLLALALASCNGSVSIGDGSAPTLRVVNLAYGAPYNFDVLDGTATVATNLGYGQATAFKGISTGSVTVKFEPTGTATVSITAGISAGSGSNYSVLALQGSTALTYLTVAQSAASLGTGQAQISFVNAAPAGGALDFYVTTPTATLPLTASQSAIAYPGDGASVSPVPLVLNSGDYRIRAVKNGDTARTVVFDSGPLTFAGGAAPLLVASPVTGSASAVAITSLAADGTVTTMADQRVLVRIGNFAPASGTVDTYFDQNGASNAVTAPFQTSVAQGVASAYQALSPGAYHASFTSSGLTTELVGGDLSLAAGTSVSVFATGVAGQAAPKTLKLVAVRDDLRAPPTGMAKLRLVFMAPDLSSSIDLVTLTTTNAITSIGQRLIVSLPYAGASPYATLTPGTYTLAAVPSSLDTPVLPASAGTSVVLAANAITTLVLTGCEFPKSGICAGTATPLHFVQLTD